MIKIGFSFIINIKSNNNNKNNNITVSQFSLLLITVLFYLISISTIRKAEAFIPLITTTSTQRLSTSSSSIIIPSKTVVTLLSAPTLVDIISKFSLNYKSSNKNTITSMTATSSSTDNNIPMVDKKTQDEFMGKTVLLTGATGGLGRSLAIQLAYCNVGTLILSARKQIELENVQKECQQISPDTKYYIIPCDLSNPISVTELAKTAIEKVNTIDVLINNGGVSSRSRFIDTKLDVDERIMQINFFSGAALAKAIIPTMLEKPFTTSNTVRGRIIWISSVQGLVGIPNRSSYAASKFAVQGYCESIRSELKSSNIIVHTISPGYIRTNLSKSAITGDGTQYGIMDETTASGSDPNDVAVTILNKVCNEYTDFTVAATFSAIAAIYMKLLCPNILQNILMKRYEKSQKQNNDKEKSD